MNTREQFGKYLLLKKLTEDPLGETFRAGLVGSKGMERVVLLRIFNGQGIDGTRLWQGIEGRQGVQQALKSPNIGDGVELGQIEGIPFVAYDYVSGKNMANLLEQAARKRNFVPAEHALLITERIALGLASAAETRVADQRVSHGFLVPHLVIISNEGETRLLGFEVGPGLRSFAANPVIRQHFGRYLSPEALAGAAPDRIDDIYSLGVVLFELLTGRPLPPPAQDGYGSVIDQGIVATEGEAIPEELRNLLKNSLVARDQRIKDVVEWHKALNKYMFDGQYNPTTFNLAFFMHNLFRQEIERESQEIEIEKTLPVPTVQSAAEEAPAAAPPPATGDVTGAVPIHSGEPSGVIETQPKKSNTGLIVGAIAAILLLAVGGWYFLGRGGPDTQAAATQPAPPPPPEPQGPDPEEIRAQIQELVSQQSEMLQQQYDDQLADLQDQLKSAQEESDRRRREQERLEREADEAAEREAAEEAERQAEEERIAEEERKQAEADKQAEKAAAEEAAKLAEAKPAVPTPTPTPTPTPRPAAPTPSGSTPTSSAPPPAAPKVLRGDLVELGPGVNPPVAIRSPQPKYPEMARRFNKTSASVLVRALIDENGKVIKTEVASEPQKFGFDKEAETAVRKSLYRPATKDGVPVKVWHTIEVVFRQ